LGRTRIQCVLQLSRLTNHDACQPSRHHRTASCLATCKGSFWRYACREFSHQRPPDIVTDHPHNPCMGSRAIFDAIQILMEPWFPMCWACFCDYSGPWSSGAASKLLQGIPAPRLGGDWGGAGEEAGCAKNKRSSWVPDSGGSLAVSSLAQYGVMVPSWKCGSVEVGRLTADVLTAHWPLPSAQRPRAWVLTLALPACLCLFWGDRRRCASSGWARTRLRSGSWVNLCL
jgi:hypothetical protein